MTRFSVKEYSKLIQFHWLFQYKSTFRSFNWQFWFFNQFISIFKSKKDRKRSTLMEYRSKLNRNHDPQYNLIVEIVEIRIGEKSTIKFGQLGIHICKSWLVVLVGLVVRTGLVAHDRLQCKNKSCISVLSLYSFFIAVSNP